MNPRRKRPQLRRLLLLVAAFACLLASANAFAGTNTEEAQRLFDAGQYEAAERLFTTELERDANNAAASLGIAKIYARTGRYEALVDALEKAKADEATKREARLMEAEFLLLTGEYKTARKSLEKFLDDNPDDLRAMALLGTAYHIVGKKNEGDRVFNAFAQVFNKGKADTPESLLYVGVAMRATESFEDANYAFGEAIALDDKYVAAYLAAGQLFLEKYNYRDADRMLRKALELDPKHPDVLVGMARTAMESDHAVDEARGYLATALEVNPNHMGAMEVMAEIALADEMTDDAMEWVDKALEVNPNRLHALALKATAHYVDDDEKAQKVVEKQVLKINPRYADMYVTMADFGEIVHRYEEGIALYEKAIDLDKSYWKAFVGLGVAYTRIGDDTKGFEYLEKAYNSDPYNVRAFNLVELYDHTLDKYEWVETENMRIRLERNEKDLLELYIPPLMEGAYSLFQRKYDFTPAKGLSVEVFADTQHFYIRSVGLPAHGGHLGICFGKLITSRSPSQGNFNWAQTLWHELAHVFHIQLSDSRVPRWFTEGLAEYETIVARREWQREHEVELYIALQNKKLYGVDQLNYGFTHAENLNETVVAYYQASLVIEYIDRTYGTDVFAQMLEGWADRKDQKTIFQEVLGVTTEDFDRGFETWVGEKLSFLEKSYELDLNGYVVRYETFIEAAAAAPDDAEAQAEAGLAELFAFNTESARALMSKSLELDPNSAKGNYLNGIIALREGAYEKAKESYAHMVELGFDGYTIRSELGFIHLKLGETDEAIKHYEKAKTFYDRGQEPYRELAKLYEAQGDKRAVRKELEALLSIEQHDYTIAARLVDMALDAGETTDARRYGEVALDIYPFDPELHLKMAEIGKKEQDWMLAEREFLAYLALEPGNPGDAYIGLAEVYVELGQSGAARDYIDRARAVNPNDTRLSAIESRL